MRKLVFLIVVSMAFLACHEEEVNKEDEAGMSKLRIKNETPYLFNNVFVKIGDRENNFGPLNPNETSLYKSFDRTSYPYIKVSMEEEEVEFQVQPIEASPFAEGDGVEIASPLTCVIQVNEATSELDLYFIE